MNNLELRIAYCNLSLPATLVVALFLLGSAKVNSAPQAAAALPIKFAVNFDPPKTGDNVLKIAITDGNGEAVAGAKVAATVSMITMDMGVTHPSVSDVGGGHYIVIASFSMSGSWNVTLKAAIPGLSKPQGATFRFDVK